MDTIDNKRSFTLEDGREFFVTDPNTEDIKSADWMYSKTYTKSLVDGISTSSEMMDILTKRGIIGPEYEKRAQELTDVLNEAIEELNNATDTDDKYSKAMRVAEARDDLFRWNQRFSGPMSHTCEQLADDARLECLTSAMIRDSQGKRVWNSYDEYVNDSDQELVSRSRIEVMLYLQGVSSDFMNETPEALAMREVEQELSDQYDEANKLEEALAQDEAESASSEESKNGDVSADVNTEDTAKDTSKDSASKKGSSKSKSSSSKSGNKKTGSGKSGKKKKTDDDK